MENWHHKLDSPVKGEPEEEGVPVPAEQKQETKDPKEELDFATPYLLWGMPEDKEEIELKKRIMQDIKDRISRKAEYISTCYHEESKHLSHLMKHGCKEVGAADEGSYADCVQRILHRLQVMEKKMKRYQIKAPRDYCNLLLKVLQHPKLNKFSIQEEMDAAEELERLENVKVLHFAYKLRAADKGSCCRLDYAGDFSRGAYDDGDDGDEESSEEYQARKTRLTMEEARRSMSPSVVGGTSGGCGAKAREGERNQRQNNNRSRTRRRIL